MWVGIGRGHVRWRLAKRVGQTDDHFQRPWPFWEEEATSVKSAVIDTRKMCGVVNKQLNHLVIDLGSLRGQCRKVGCYTSFDKVSVHLLHSLAVGYRAILWNHREVKAVRSIELYIDETRRQDAATKIDDVVRSGKMPIQYLLAVQDLSSHRADP
jgi:hypothetical protein